MLRTVGAVVALSLLNFTTCRSPGENGPEPTVEAPKPTKVVDLPGVDTSALTTREKKQWSSYVTQLLAPCPDTPVSLAQCVLEKRNCNLCAPAASLLVQQVRRGKTRTEAEGFFRARFAPDVVKTIELGDSPSLGKADAPVVLVEWADFECPFCGQAHPKLKRLLEEYPDTLRFVFKHYPLGRHPNAEYAARAAAAAGKQGKFWEMHHVLFENQDELDKGKIELYARQIGLDITQFRADFDSEAVADEVARDRKQGDALEISSTPSMFINGRAFDLKYFSMSEDLAEWIELEAELRTGKRPKPQPVSKKKKDDKKEKEDAEDEPKKKDADEKPASKKPG